MKKLLMLLIVLALSLPAYANGPDVLVYKVTMTGRQFDPQGIEKEKVRGYLVLEVDANEMSNLDNGDEVYPQGAQILYVKDGRKKWRSTAGIWGLMEYYQPGKKKGTMFLDADHAYMLGTHEGMISSVAYGTVRRILIGTGKPKPRIPTKLKGHARFGGGWDASCRLTVKLDSKRTKNANKENKTYEQVADELWNRLERKGYNPPPPED